jgi:photosynthetic reaction center cytochrome c subunit
MHNARRYLRPVPLCCTEPEESMRKAIFAAIVALSLPAARAEQKNVKLLTGMNDTQLIKTMNMMRASLGVHCDFCHVVNEKTGWDFASDEKQPKRMARHMIEMVEGINQQNFENNPVVSCNTCHRGSTRPWSLVTLPQTPPPFPTPIPAKPTLPTRDEVVSKYAAAVGDASRWQLTRVLRGTREGSDGKTTPFEAETSAGKWHVVGDTPRGRLEQGISGAHGWIRSDKGVQPMKEDDVEHFHELADLYEPLPPQAIPADARVVNKEKIGEHDAVILLARLNDTTRERLFFDTQSGLLLRRVLLTRVPIGEIPEQTDFDDYRDAGGTKFPFFVRLSLVDPWNSATRRYSEVQLGAKVDDSIFKAPTSGPSPGPSGHPLPASRGEGSRELNPPAGSRP